MKKLNLLLILFIGVIIFSCSSDDNEQLTVKELLIQGSPWIFSKYEMIKIIDAGNSNFTKSELENDVNIQLKGSVLIFNQNGTYSVSYPNEGIETWNWKIINDNELKLIFDSGNSKIYKIFNVTTNQLIIEIPNVLYDQDVRYEVSHYGKAFYD
jgi:hypothetical protein